MANKDYQNLSTQASGSITKVTPFQIKSNDSLGSLAIDLEAFRGQITDIIGGGVNYKENLSVGSYPKVNLTNLKNHIDAASGSSLNIIQGLIVTGSTTFGSSINVVGTSTFGTISASTMEFTSASINGNAGIAGNLSVTGSSILDAVSAGTITFSSASITTNAGIVGNLSVTGSSILGAVSAGTVTHTSSSNTGNAGIAGNLSVTGSSILGAVSAGTITFSSASITTNAGIAGNLSVTGSSILGAVSAGTVTHTSSSNTGNAGIAGNLSVTGSSTLVGNVTFGGDILNSAPGPKNIFIGAGNNTIAIGGATSTVSIPGTGSIGTLTVVGDLTVNGTTTTINSTTVTVDDKNIVLGAVAGATDAGADGGGITLSGSTDHTIIWRDASDAWEFSENVIANGNGTKDLGNASNRWRNVFAGTGSFSNGTNIVTIQHDRIFGTAILTVSASAGDVVLDDKWRTSAVTTFGSTPGIKLSNSSAEWTTFNSNFGSQNSILGALNSIGASTSNPRKLTYNISASYTSGSGIQVDLGTFADGTIFNSTAMTDKNALVFYNGQLLGSGSTAQVQAFPATADYSVNAGLDNFRFGFPVSNGDIVVIKLD